MADCHAVTLAKDLPGTGQMSARKGFCHDEVQGLGTAGRWDGQAACMEGGPHERGGVSVWGHIRTRQHVHPVWGAAHRWGMGATAATWVRGGRDSWWWGGMDRGGGQQGAGRRSAWRAAHGVEGGVTRRGGSDASHGTHILVIH